MKVAYLSTAQPGLRWMRSCRLRHPRLDVRRVGASLRTAETVLAAHPAAGRRFEDFDAVREYLVQSTSDALGHRRIGYADPQADRTFFSLVYTIARDTVWIIDVRDQRGQRDAEALRQFLRELRALEQGVD